MNNSKALLLRFGVENTFCIHKIVSVKIYIKTFCQKKFRPIKIIYFELSHALKLRTWFYQRHQLIQDVNNKLKLDYLSHRKRLICICRTGKLLSFKRAERYRLECKISLCLHCGHVLNTEPLSDSSTLQFYSSSDYRTVYFPGESRESVFWRKISSPSTGINLLKYVNSALKLKSGHIVEWGCGGGWNLVPFDDAGWTVEGYDFDAPYLRLGSMHLGFDLKPIQADTFGSLPNKRPDVILVNHVLEHVTDPKALIESLKSWCGSETLVVVGIPLLETIKQWHWNDFFHIGHVHYFSTRSFVRFVNSTGFCIIDSNSSTGMFALKQCKFSTIESAMYRGAVPISVYLLLRGYLDLEYRSRALVRKVLKSFRLLDLARRTRSLIKGLKK